MLAVAAMAAVVLCCAGPLWLAGRLAFPRRRRPVTVGITATVLMCCVVAATLTIFRPLDTTRRSPGSAPMTAAGVRYWDLPTGSHLAYTVIHAQGIRRPTPVIRLHGGPGTPGDAPDDLDRALAARGFDVYEYDQLGSGRSTRLSDPAGYTVDRQVADLEAIRTTIGAPQVILLGSSWGASLGAEYIGAHPDRVARVVFTSPGTLWAPEWAEQNEGDIWDRLTPRQQSRIDRLETNPRLIAWSLLMDVNPAAAHALVPDSEIDMVFAELLDIAGPAASCHPDRPIDAPSAVPGMYANQLISADQLDRPDPRPALRRAHVPALVLRGSCDYKRWEIAREYRDTLPDATLLVVPDAGHVTDADQPELYIAAVTGFLTGESLPLPAYTGREEPAATVPR